METEAIRVGVVMQRRLINNRWQPYAWSPIAIAHDRDVAGPPECVKDDENDWQWLTPGMEVSLHSIEAEGYFLNATSPAPCWFVMWRIEEVDGHEIAVPKAVTLSYNEGARMMDGGEQVDTVPLEPQYIEHLRAFCDAYYQPEPRKKRRKPSFEGGAAVEQMAKAEGEIHGGR